MSRFSVRISSFIVDLHVEVCNRVCLITCADIGFSFLSNSCFPKELWKKIIQTANSSSK